MKMSEYLTKRRLTDSEAARELKVPPSTVMRWRTGVCVPSLKHAIMVRDWSHGRVTLTDWS